ncbi:MAG TPA: hypothetical protein VEV84_07785 [Pyrinomonadaceae bacterium]|jgi:hypothetical protein|nr:hypothetical protein [Pyrinomonadaceae bacterium]
MRTTLDIDEDVLQGAKEIAEHEGISAGRVISDWARRGFAYRYHQMPPKQTVKYRNGVPQFPSRGEIITNEHINRIRDEEGI